MPLTRISLRRGKPKAYKAAIVEQVYQAMRETFDVPADDRFVIVTEHDDDDLDYGREYLGIERSDDFMILQITANNTRTVAQKKALYKSIANRLADDPGVRPEDIFISLVEVTKDNWSFGHGLAQYT